MSASQLVLNSLNVIITRPHPYGESLFVKVLSLGGKPTLFPTLEIIGHNREQLDHLVLAQIPFQDVIIFTSQNAVVYAKNVLKKITSQTIAAIGIKTKEALIQFGLKVAICPQDIFSSERLLCLPYFENIQNKKILIIKGQGGRDHLELTLKSRGAGVLQLAVYQRRLPSEALVRFTQLTSLKNAIVIATSCESLSNLLKLAASAGKSAWVNEIPIVVISQRMKDYGISEGLAANNLIVAQNPTDEAILDCLIKWYA